MSLFNIGGVSVSGAALNLQTWSNPTATSGTDAANTANTVYYGSLYVPGQTNVTALNILVGSVGGTDKVIGQIFDISGKLLANTAIAGVIVGTAAQVQTIPLTMPKLLDGPNNYIIGLVFNGTTAKFRAIPAYCGSGLAGTVTQTFGTVGDIVIPATRFTADNAPVVYLS